MANLRDIKRRITSIQSTQKITSAMKMVAAAKLRRAQEMSDAAQPYAEHMRTTLEEVSAGGGGASHPLFEVRDEKRSLEIVAITSDRGLAGAFNSQVIKATERLIGSVEKDFEEIHLSLLGKKVSEYYRRHRPAQVVQEGAIGANVVYGDAERMARHLIGRFESGEVDEVQLVHNEFVSTMTQRPKVVPLLPFVPPQAAEAAETAEHVPYEIEPDAERVLSVLVPKAVEVEIFRAMLENQAGEHAARMTAMENATKNTQELIEKLTLAYNRARQAAITSELVEIITGAQALE